ncbi:MAG: hypothetical protein E4H10_04030 [Bacteroidia bacterium]|nr:MAG: hypothetical protein E4H10_04030 [Bacteroidia bacterium]
MWKSILILLLLPLQEKQDYPLKNGRPTSKGIEQYVEDNSEALIREYQDFIGDTLYNIYIYTMDLTENGYFDPRELGRYYPNEIFITNKEVFMAYELSGLSKKGRDTVTASNLFVKGAVFHELTHDYIYQVSMEMSRIENISLYRAYQAFFKIYGDQNDMGSKFIEEGICEYVTGKMGEIIPPRKPLIPKKMADLTDEKNSFNIYYKYSSHYLSNFLDTTGIKRGIKILLHNPPPSSEEILNPELFFTRLQGID